MQIVFCVKTFLRFDAKMQKLKATKANIIWISWMHLIKEHEIT